MDTNLDVYSVGDLRYRLPQTIPAYNGTFSATSFGPSCGQQAIDLPIVTGLAADAADFITNSIYGQIFPDSEDCKFPSNRQRVHINNTACFSRPQYQCCHTRNCDGNIQITSRSCKQFLNYKS